MLYNLSGAQDAFVLGFFKALVPTYRFEDLKHAIIYRKHSRELEAAFILARHAQVSMAIRTTLLLDQVKGNLEPISDDCFVQEAYWQRLQKLQDQYSEADDQTTRLFSDWIDKLQLYNSISVTVDRSRTNASNF